MDLLEDDVKNCDLEPCIQNSDSENKNESNSDSYVICTHQNNENISTSLTKMKPGSGMSKNPSFQNSEPLIANTEPRILKQDGICFRNIGITNRINKALKKSSLSILRGPSIEIPQVSLMEYFEKQFSQESFDASQIAIMNNTKSSFTYSYFNDSVNMIANTLREQLLNGYDNHNTNKDIVIAVCLPPYLKYRMSVIFAILKLGATYLPINQDYPAEKIRASLDGSKVIASIISRTDRKVMDTFQNLEDFKLTGHLIFIENLCKSAKGNPDNKITEFPPANILEIENSTYPKPKERTVCILPSFNSIGVYSGIRYNSHVILNLLYWDTKTFLCEKEHNDCVISYFIATPDCMEAIKEIFFTLLTGKTLAIFSQKILTHPIKLLEHIHLYHITKLVVYPRSLQYIISAAEILSMESSRTMFTYLKVCFCIGEPISIELATLFFQYAGDDKQLVVLYGHDENTSTVTYQAYNSLNDLKEMEYCNYLPVGTPINNYKLYIVSQSMKLVSLGVVGEICLSGSTVNEMYGLSENTNKLTKNKFTKSKSKDFKFLLRTGNYGRIVDNRLVYETGRNKHVYIDEHYFNLDEVTELLRSWNYLMHSYYIFLCYQSERDPIPKLIVFVDWKEKTEGQHSAILSYLAKKLPTWALPEIISIKSIPQSPSHNGIINTVLDEYEDQKRKSREFSDWKSLGLVSPEEIKAAKVLLLSVSNILLVSVEQLANNLSKSIFDFGATSFICVKMVQQLNKNGYHVTMDDIEESKSLLELISKMVDRISAVGVIELVLSAPKVFDKYQLEMTMKDHKKEVIEMLAHCYTRKDTLDYFSQVHPKEFKKFLDGQWHRFTKGSSSLTLKRLKDKKIVGAILSFDWSNRKLVNKGISKAISQRLQLHQYLEDGFCIESENAKKGKPVRALQIAHFGLFPNLFHLSELYEITNKMISEIIDLAKSLRYTTILMTVYDLYIAELCELVWGFTLIRECQANKIFTEDDREPYGEAPDCLICKFMMKEL